MRSTFFAASCIAALAGVAHAAANHSQSLPSAFAPPQVFKNAHLVRLTSLDRAYARETLTVVIENTSPQPQSEYYLPIAAGPRTTVGGFEAHDKTTADPRPLAVDIIGPDFFRIRLATPLAPQQQQTLTISYALLSALQPVPAQLAQTAKQYLRFAFSAYAPSAYPTDLQKTKLKLPTADVPEYTTLPAELATEHTASPQRQGTIFTYGTFANVPAEARLPASVRYQFTKPLLHAERLERDLEVSHWGGNLATEERYWLVNQAAALERHFSRVEWQRQSFTNPATMALRGLVLPLAPGVLDPYFIDDIGNVSTSRFGTSRKEALLELKPRYPVFGQWKYSFRVGWNADLATYLRKVAATDAYVLKVPFLEGPRAGDGISYARVTLRVILPEGATNVQFATTVPIVDNTTTLHKTFMDTLGRTTLTLTAVNLIDEFRNRELLVTYDYPRMAGYRKPLVIAAAVFSLFAATWVIGSIDTSIGKKKDV